MGSGTIRKQTGKLPAALIAEEVSEVLAFAPGLGLKYCVPRSISYGAGLRDSEVCRLTTSDIDSDRMFVHIVEGKGRKIMRSPDLLRDYWCEARPEGWLFPGKPKINPISPRQLNRAFTSAKRMARINKPATLHTLRHSFAKLMVRAVEGGRRTYYPRLKGFR